MYWWFPDKKHFGVVACAFQELLVPMQIIRLKIKYSDMKSIISTKLSHILQKVLSVT